MLLTPCVKICKVKNGHCLACKRTLEEIAKWSTISDDEKLEIMKLLKERILSNN
jgi:hypothetical protein